MTVVSQLLMMTFSAQFLLMYQYCIQQPETAIAFLAQSVRHKAIALFVAEEGRCDRFPSLKRWHNAIALCRDCPSYSCVLSSSSSVDWNRSVALLPSSPKIAPMPIFQVVLQVSKMRVCWGRRLSLLASHREVPPERRVKQTTVKKTCWKAGGSLTFFMSIVFSFSTLPSSA